MPKLRTALVLATVTLAFLTGCQSTEPQRDERLQGEERFRSEEFVQARLEEMVLLATSDFVDALDRLRSSTDDADLQRRTIVAKTRVVPAIRKVLDSPNPLDGLVDLWVLTLQLRELFRTSERLAVWGEHAADLANVGDRVAGRIAEQLRRVLGEQNFQQARAGAEEFVRENPLTADMSRSGMLQPERPSTSSGGGLFSWIPTINLNPFGGVGEGISEGAAAILAFSKEAGRFTAVVDSIPDRLSWQLELFQHDFAHNPAIVDANRSVATIGASVERIATTAETLPEDVREQVSLAVDELQPELESVRTTLAEAREAGAALERTATAFEEAAGSMEGMAAQLDTTLQTFHKLMRYLNGDVDAAGNPVPPRDPTAETGPRARPFDVTEFDQTARSLTGMAAELQTTLQEFRATLADPALGSAIGEVGGTARQSVASLVRDATIAAIVVIVAFFGTLLLYRRLSPTRAS